MLRLPISRALQSFRQPAYTGENRCYPCTIVNVALALIVGGAIALLWPPVGVFFTLLAFVLIYARGYVIPRTPTLTRRYFPRSLLALFDKRPGPASEATESSIAPEEADVGLADGETAVDQSTREEPPDRTPEAVLRDAAVLLDEGEDEDLAETFVTDWRQQLAAMRRDDFDSAVRDRLGSILTEDAARMAVERSEAGPRVTVTVDGRTVGQWISAAALAADAAAAPLLAESDTEWEQLDPAFRGTVLTSLRVFVPECPDCGGDVEFGTEDDGCCGFSEAYTLRCIDSDCSTLLYRVDRGAADAALG